MDGNRSSFLIMEILEILEWFNSTFFSLEDFNEVEDGPNSMVDENWLWIICFGEWPLWVATIPF